MKSRQNGWLIGVSLWGALVICSHAGCTAENTNKANPSFTDSNGTPAADGSIADKSGSTIVPPQPQCPNGIDNDNDGFGEGCPAGPDCDDNDAFSYPGASELCDSKDNDCDGQSDNGAINACGTCDPGCLVVGDQPFVLDSATDPSVQKAEGVGLDENGDLILHAFSEDRQTMWIPNMLDWGRGTISKIDTVTMKETGRFFTTTCTTTTGPTGCDDLHGRSIWYLCSHNPSRTAVDYNFDVWVVNQYGQQSVTKIAEDEVRCVDRNGNSTIETSVDRNGDGEITVDCDGNGQPDSAGTTCTKGSLAGLPPEFYGDDDECVLFTVTFDQQNQVGRSVCLSPDKFNRPTHAWVATHDANVNNFYRIDGPSGALSGPYPLPQGHRPFGCVIDAQGILWSPDQSAGTLVAMDTKDPSQVSAKITPPYQPHRFYGMAMDLNDAIWLGGDSSFRIYRYQPDRTSFDTLGNGSWTGIKYPTSLGSSTGIALDHRGKVWVATSGGYLWQTEQNVNAGEHDEQASQSYWQLDGNAASAVAVDMKGSVWGVSTSNDLASRLDVDAQGQPTLPAKSKTNKLVKVGDAPFPYSDFSGYGVMGLLRPDGRYGYRIQPCAEPQIKASWKEVRWEATTPSNAAVKVRIRTGDDEKDLSAWTTYQTSSPLSLDAASLGLDPNPARILELEFLLHSDDSQTTPILHRFEVLYACKVDLD